MTREEATEIIRNYDVNGCGYCHQGGNEVEEAFEMAIKALSAELCEDCISRDKVHDLIAKVYSGYLLDETREVLQDLDCEVAELPSIQPKPKTEWIPVSERLPKEGETVLVCYQTQGGVAQSVCEWFEMHNRGITWSTLCGKKPIAWMPLPKPYKAESEE